MVGRSLKRAGSGLYDRWRRAPLAQDTVLYEAFAGSGIGCNPAAVFEALLADPGRQDLRHVWVLTRDGAYTARARKYADHPRVEFVRYRSPGYFRRLAQARILVNNVTFPTLFRKRPDQFYLNTWHGTPYKKMGRDAPGPESRITNTVSNLASADVLLSTGPYMTSTMYSGAFGLDARQVAEVGSPRVDVQFAPDRGPSVRARLTAAGLSVGPGRILLYAPTWREASATTAVDDSAALADRVARIADALTDRNWTVLLRVHDKVAGFAGGQPGLRGHLVPEAVSTNEVLSITDALVTDYSSVFFDYLATGTHTYFLTPDIDDYRASRGLYLAAHQLPGPTTSDVGQLCRWLSDDEEPPAGHVGPTAARRRFCPHEDGAATDRVTRLLPV